MIPKHIQDSIEHLKSIGQFRELRNYEKGIDFFSNDYLGLGKSFIDCTHEDAHWGSTGSRLISGNHYYYDCLENFLSQWLKKTALIFGSGYMANLGVLSSIPTRHDTILYDSLCHASLKDGIRLSLAKSYPFAHNDYEKLENLIKKSSGDIYVVVESVYSMDGDSPNPEILKSLVSKYGVYLIVDEAHSFGICGEEGKGWIQQNHLEEYTFLGIFPMGKAVGAYGAFVLAESVVIQYLINHARTFIYSTALPPALLYGIYQNLLKLRTAEKQRKHIKELSKYFDYQWIYPLIVPGNEECKNYASVLQSHGILVKAILSPTVPVRKERIRIVLHATNTVEEVNLLVSLIKAPKNKNI